MFVSSSGPTHRTCCLRTDGPLRLCLRFLVEQMERQMWRWASGHAGILAHTTAHLIWRSSPCCLLGVTCHMQRFIPTTSTLALRQTIKCCQCSDKNCTPALNCATWVPLTSRFDIYTPTRNARQRDIICSEWGRGKFYNATQGLKKCSLFQTGRTWFWGHG